VVAIVGLLLASSAAPGMSAGPYTAAGDASLRQARIDRMLDDLQARIERATARIESSPFSEGVSGSAERLATPARAVSMPANVQLNNKGGDGAGTTQSGSGIAIDGEFGIASWNDGIGGASGLQGLAYTTNGGATWTDIGALPTSDGVTSWSGSPTCAVNTATHEFYVIGIGGALEQIAMCRVTFAGSTFVISAPIVVHQRSGTDLVEQPWLTVDPVSGSVYATWTKFVAGTTSRIEFARSTTGGTIWSAPQVLSAPAFDGLVEGPRIQVGPNGEVYTVWHQIGLTDADFVKIRKSTSLGVSFGSETTAFSFFANFGSGAPGFNRLRSVDDPSIAVDVSTGPHRGRVYVAVNESVNWFDDPLGAVGNRSEVESNGTTATATPFLSGETLRGSLAIASPSPDYWSFGATQGTTYVFVVDSLAAMYYTMRLFCTDGATSLAQTGDSEGCPGSASALVWTAPASGTYWLRMATVSVSVAGCPPSTSGGYRVRTGINANPGAGAEIARDQRDIVVAYSDDGVAFTKVRANDDPGHLDDFLPEVQVAGDGCPYVLWLDWRDSEGVNCGGSSASYVTRSTTGGATYASGQRVASALTNWNVALANLTPNMGDRIGLHASGRTTGIAMAWGDGRLGDIDVFGATASSAFALSSCPGAQVVAPAKGGVAVDLSATVENHNLLFANTYAVSVTSSRGWPMVVAPTVAVPAGGSANVPFTIQLPETAKAGLANACLILTLNGGADAETCCVPITVDRPVATLASVIEAFADPGRVEIEWQVMTAGPVSVERSRDGIVWNRLGSATPDGAGRVRHRDDAVAAAGRYGYRLGLMTADGERNAGEVWIDVPAAASFALGVVRNPVTDGIPVVRFSLPGPQPATLEFLDPSGRRLHRQDVGVLGAGSHVLAFPELRGRLGEGVILVRLTQGGRTITRKLSVLR
jgi:hypothetical protein